MIDCIIASPPFADQLPTNGQGYAFVPPHDPHRRLIDSEYGHSTGQMGVMPPGKVEDVT